MEYNFFQQTSKMLREILSVQPSWTESIYCTYDETALLQEKCNTALFLFKTVYSRLDKQNLKGLKKSVSFTQIDV